MAMTKRLWSLSSLAVELDRDRRTVAAALSTVPADGKIGRAKAWHLRTALVALGIMTGPTEKLDPAQERARKDRALAESTEMRNDIARVSVVPIDVVIGAVSAETLRMKNKLLGLPVRIAPRAAILQTAEPIRALLEEGILEALGELTIAGGADLTLAGARQEIARRFGPDHA